jgi:chaperonin GroEL (HSP60 family)
VALLYASKSLDAVKEKLENFDQTVGVQILQTALRVPLKTIADNAGELHLRMLFLCMQTQLCMCHCIC